MRGVICIALLTLLSSCESERLDAGNGRAVAHNARVSVYCQEQGPSRDGVDKCLQFYAKYPSIDPPSPGTYTTPAAAALSRATSSSPPQLQPSSVKPTSPEGIEVSLRQQAGVLYVPVTINGAIQLSFLIDSGASDVAVPADVVMTLVRTGTISNADFLGKRTYTLADGASVPSTVFRIRSLKVGDRVLENVIGSVAPVKGDLLLGQSFLSRFRSWSIDNSRHILILR
jgi:clan AA aspartic protease (TIGR02281 family)